MHQPARPAGLAYAAGGRHRPRPGRRLPSPVSRRLCQPRIPPNTGNIIRLSTPGMEKVGPRREQRPSANTGARLHLIEPLGFRLGDRELRRAGLDYHEWAFVKPFKL